MVISNAEKPQTGSFEKTGDNIRGSAGWDVTHLPNDLFLLIISYLSPQDIVLCQRVSRDWRAAFGSNDLSYNLMRWHFPRCRELRNLPATMSEHAYCRPTPPPDWTAIFTRVARRYHHLRAAQPRSVEKIEVLQETASSTHHRGVEPWNRWLRWNENTSVFQHRDPVWCLDDGLLIYPDPAGRYVAYDLETGQRFNVPFDGSDKTVRRLRLACGVLVIEWCEREPYHQLNDRETVHRHFATAFDVEHSSSSSPSSASSKKPPSSDSSSRSSSGSNTSGSRHRRPNNHADSESAASRPRASVVRASSPPGPSWRIVFRSEWKIHFLGLPLNRHDRFFSAHTATHYAAYLWQPNRSPWGEEDPLEQLTVWDISFPSAYRPSADPSGGGRPPDPDLGPAVIRRLTWRDLEHLGLRQRNTPALRGVLLDDRNVYVHEEDHRWLAGRHSGLTPPRHHHVRCTGVPFAAIGPRWFDQCCADGDVHLSFCPRSGSAARLLGSRAGVGDDSFNPSPFLSSMAAPLHPLPLRSSSPLSSSPPPSSSSSSSPAPETTTTGTPDGGGLIDPTWPGWAPCWRHEEFPYLSVGEMVDVGAGVRVVARQCFMVETLSAFVLPRISIECGGSGPKGGGGGGDGADGDLEVRFRDDMWGHLLAKGRLEGDERWVVGEDGQGRVTVVRF